MKREIRNYVAQFENNKVVGRIPYNSLSELLGNGNKVFREMILPGAFAKSLSKDIKAYFSHDSAAVLGRVKNQTLKIADGPDSLHFEIELPQTQLGNDIRELVSKGYIDGASFSFVVNSGGDKWTKKDGQLIRELTDVELLEISLVSEPAYPETEAAIRSLEVWEKEAYPCININDNKKKLNEILTWY